MRLNVSNARSYASRDAYESVAKGLRGVHRTRSRQQGPGHRETLLVAAELGTALAAALKALRRLKDYAKNGGPPLTADDGGAVSFVAWCCSDRSADVDELRLRRAALPEGHPDLLAAVQQAAAAWWRAFGDDDTDTVQLG